MVVADRIEHARRAIRGEREGLVVTATGSSDRDAAIVAFLVSLSELGVVVPLAAGHNVVGRRIDPPTLGHSMEGLQWCVRCDHRSATVRDLYSTNETTLLRPGMQEGIDWTRKVVGFEISHGRPHIPLEHPNATTRRLALDPALWGPLEGPAVWYPLCEGDVLLSYSAFAFGWCEPESPAPRGTPGVASLL